MTINQWVKMMRDTFEFSYMESLDDIARMQSLQKTHDNIVDETLWPTRSKIPLPLAWATVETATGPAVESMFPPSPTIRLIGRKGVDQDIVDKVQWALHLTLRHRMRIRRNCVRSIKDCFKVGVGYGIVEPITVTPPAVVSIMVGQSRARVMRRGAPVRSLRYRYISTGKIIVYPSGVEFNGDDPTPYSFFLDPMSEESFKKLIKAMRDANVDGWKSIDVEGIIKESRTQGFNSQVDFIDFVESMSGRRSMLRSGRNANYKKAPVMIPVLKCYAHEECRWTWIFPGKQWTPVFDKYDTYDTARNPLIKWDAWTDADRWIGMSQPEADERVIWQKDILVNAINDIITQAQRRPLLYDTTVHDGPPTFGPGNTLGLPGQVDKTAKYMDPPQVDGGAFEMLAQVDNIRTAITGQKDLTQRNFNRGGSMAFQDLLNSIGARDRLRHMLLETGGFQSIVDQTLIYMQTIGAGMDLAFDRQEYDQEQGRDITIGFNVTEDDLRHAYDVILDFDAKERMGSMDASMRAQLYQLKKDNPGIDQWAALEDLFFDEYTLQRQRLPREVVRKKQKEKEEADMAVLRAQAAPPAAAGGGALPGGMAGAVAGGIAGGQENAPLAGTRGAPGEVA